MGVRNAVRPSVLANADAKSLLESPGGRLRQPEDSFAPRIDFTVVALIAYALLVVTMWGNFAFSSGMFSETGFSFQSQTQSAWQGFRYSDSLRPHTSTFYQLSYLIGRVCGVAGSFVPYQFVYAALWWAKGVLVFLLLRRLVSSALFLSYVAGALALVHASDLALQWIGQLNQLGFTLWLLLSLYCFVAAVQQPNRTCAAGWLLFAGFFQYMCLWSYESPLFIILAAPLLTGFLLRPRLKRLWISSICWYVVPIVYIWLSLKRYLHAKGATYQETVLRKTWSVHSLMSDLVFNIRSSVSFWSWTRQNGYLPTGEVYRLAAVATIVFVAAAMTFVLDGKQGNEVASKPDIDFAIPWKFLALGTVLLVLSFPAYLLLIDPRTLWRTQLLSGIGAGIVLSAAFAVVAMPASKGWNRDSVVTTLSAVVIFCGASSAVERGAFFRSLWQQHRVVLKQVIGNAPQIRPETIVVLIGIPKGKDPFRDDMWFDMALRLAYPGVPVAGNYYYSDHTPGPDNPLKLSSNHWHLQQSFTNPLVCYGGLEQTIVFEYGADGNSRIVAKFPQFLCANTCSPELYNPDQRIIGETPSPMAIRRYGPL